jgi:hypothetical protein
MSLRLKIIDFQYNIFIFILLKKNENPHLGSAKISFFQDSESDIISSSFLSESGCTR